MIIASEMIVAGDMIVEQTTHPTADVFGYLRSFHPIEIVEKEKVIIDMDTQFEKSFLGIIDTIPLSV